jgi:ubiquinone/menaquinone biosynthesis C-methylase UbiE
MASNWTRSQGDWEHFIQMLAPSNRERILDVGAGNGSVANRVLEASAGAEVYAVDPSEKKAAVMRNDYPGIKSSLAAAESLPFPDSYFDKVYTTMALHHFVDLDRALVEISRVLKHGGSFVILEVEPNSLIGRLFRFFGRIAREKMNIMSEAQLLARFESSKDFEVSRSADLGSRYLIQLTRI